MRRLFQRRGHACPCPAPALYTVLQARGGCSSCLVEVGPDIPKLTTSLSMWPIAARPQNCQIFDAFRNVEDIFEAMSSYGKGRGAGLQDVVELRRMVNLGHRCRIL